LLLMKSPKLLVAPGTLNFCAPQSSS